MAENCELPWHAMPDQPPTTAGITEGEVAFAESVRTGEEIHVRDLGTGDEVIRSQDLVTGLVIEGILAADHAQEVDLTRKVVHDLEAVPTAEAGSVDAQDREVHLDRQEAPTRSPLRKSRHERITI